MSEGRRSRAIGEVLSRRYRAILLGILVFGLLLRIGVYLDLKANDIVFDIPSLDSQAFLAWARDIAVGNVLGSKVFFLNPLYPYLLAPVTIVFGPTPLFAIRGIQIALGLATILLVAGATRRLLSPGIALGAALVTAAWPLLLFYEETVMIVTVAVFLNALTLYLLARLPERPTLRRTFLAGLPLGLAILARPNVGLFAVLLPAWLLLIAPAGRRLRFAATRTALLALGAFLMVLPCTLRNWAVGHDFVLVTSSGGVNLYVSNNPEARKIGRMASRELRANPALIETDAILEAERATGRRMKPSEVSAYWSEQAWASARDAPLATLGFMGKKLLMFFRGFEIPSSYHYEAVSEQTAVLGRIPVSWWLFSPFMLVGLVAALARRRTALPFALLYLAYAIGLAIFFPLAHYRAPVLPGAIPLAILGLVTIAVPVLDADYRGALRWAPLLLLCLVCSYPARVSRWLGHPVFSGSEDDRVVFWYNRGMVLLGHGRIDAAEATFQKGVRADPTSWLPYMGLANVARARGELANEKRHLEDALRLRPHDPGVLSHLALNLYDRGQRREGVELGLKVIEQAPNDGTALGFTAQMLEREGRAREAFKLYRRAEDSGLPRQGIIADECHCLRSMGAFDQAVANAERGLRLYPDAAFLYYEKALALIGRSSPPGEIHAAIRAGEALGTKPPPPLQQWLREHRR